MAREITPFIVEVLPLNVTSEESMSIAEELYKALSGRGIQALLDDRDERAGVKFKDADLYGIPVLAVIGERNLKEGVVELRIRDKDIVEKVKVEDITAEVIKAVEGG